LANIIFMAACFILAAVLCAAAYFIAYACLAFFGLTDDLEEQRRNTEGLDLTGVFNEEMED